MTSKKSFLVNLKTNARRRIWLVVVMFLSFLLSVTVVNAMNLSMEKMYYGKRNNLAVHLGRVFANGIGLNMGIGILVSAMAVIAAVQGFSYMYQRKKLDLYMSVPVTANRRFAAVYLNGILAYFIPYLCSVILSFVAAQAMGADITSRAFREAGLALCGNTILFLAVYHIAILAVMLTGNMIVTLMGVVVLLFYDLFAYALHSAYMATFFNSYYYATADKFERYLISPLARFANVLAESFSYVGYGYERVSLPGRCVAGFAPIVIVGAAALALAFWCYRKKPAEVCGKAMAFPKTKAIIKVLITIEAGLAGGVIFYGLSGESMPFLVIGLIAGTLLCHGTVEVVYDFDIRSVKNGWKSLLVSAGAVAVIYCVFQFDLIGYDSYVPEPDEVDHIAFSFMDEYYNNYYDEELDSVDRGTYIFEHMQITDIAPVLELAQKRMGTEREDGDAVAYRYCLVRYQMKDGSYVFRRFPSVYMEDVALLDEIVTDPAYQQGSSTIYNEPFVGLGDALTVYYDSGSGRKELESVSVKELVGAYRKDLAELSFTDMMKQRIRGKLQLECVEQGVYISSQFPVYPGFENTIALLEREQLYKESYIDLDDVDYMVVTNSNSELYDAYTDSEAYDDGVHVISVTYADFQTEASFEDRGEIEQIASALYPDNFMEFWTPGDTLDTDYSVTVVYKNGIETEDNINAYTGSYYMLADRIPDFVKEKTVYKGEN